MNIRGSILFTYNEIDYEVSNMRFIKDKDQFNHESGYIEADFYFGNFNANDYTSDNIFYLVSDKANYDYEYRIIGINGSIDNEVIDYIEEELTKIAKNLNLITHINWTGFNVAKEKVRNRRLI